MLFGDFLRTKIYTGATTNSRVPKQIPSSKISNLYDEIHFPFTLPTNEPNMNRSLKFLEKKPRGIGKYNFDTIVYPQTERKRF